MAHTVIGPQEHVLERRYKRHVIRYVTWSPLSSPSQVRKENGQHQQLPGRMRKAEYEEFRPARILYFI